MIELKPGTSTATFVDDPYFPLWVQLGPENDDIHHMGFYKDLDNLLEIKVDFCTNRLDELTLVNCASHTIVDNILANPPCQNGILFFRMPDHVDCPDFHTFVHRDGVRFVLRQKLTFSWLQSGNLVFGLSAEEEVTEIRVVNLSAEEVAIVTAKLREEDEERGKPIFPERH